MLWFVFFFKNTLKLAAIWHTTCTISWSAERVYHITVELQEKSLKRSVWGTFHPMKNSVLDFWKFLVTSGTAVSRISGKHCKVYSNFQKFLIWNFCCIIKKQPFPAIPETSQKMSKLFVPVLKFKEFLVEWKAPNF